MLGVSERRHDPRASVASTSRDRTIRGRFSPTAFARARAAVRDRCISSSTVSRRARRFGPTAAWSPIRLLALERLVGDVRACAVAIAPRIGARRGAARARASRDRRHGLDHAARSDGALDASRRSSRSAQRDAHRRSSTDSRCSIGDALLALVGRALARMDVDITASDGGPVRRSRSRNRTPAPCCCARRSTGRARLDECDAVADAGSRSSSSSPRSALIGFAMLGGILLLDQLGDSAARIARDGALAAREGERRAHAASTARRREHRAHDTHDALSRRRAQRSSSGRSCDVPGGWAEPCRVSLGDRLARRHQRRPRASCRPADRSSCDASAASASFATSTRRRPTRSGCGSGHRT